MTALAAVAVVVIQEADAATVEARDVPHWCLMAVQYAREEKVHLCPACRRAVREVLIGWFCSGC